MELWDAYDINFNKIDGITLTRGSKIPEGLFHLVCNIVVKHIDGTYLLMKRDLNKHLGGYWQLTAGGSAIKGESSLECGIRELFEETGIKVTNLCEVGRDVNHQRHNIYVEYYVEVDVDKNSVTLQEGETIDFKWVSKEELKTIYKTQLCTTRPFNFIKDLMEY